ncbi:hypothetical protein YC2023_070189 [Brassica napus]
MRTFVLDFLKTLLVHPAHLDKPAFFKLGEPLPTLPLHLLQSLSFVFALSSPSSLLSHEKPLSFLSMSLSVSEAAAPPPLASAIPLPFISSLGDLIYRFRIQKQNISYGYLFTNLGGQPFGQVPVLLDGHLKLTVATKGISVNEPVIWIVLGEVMPDRSVVGWILRDVKGEMKCLRGAPSVSRSFTDLRLGTLSNKREPFTRSVALMLQEATPTLNCQIQTEGTIFLEIKRLVSNISPAAALMEKGQMVMTRATKVCKPLEPVEPIRWSSYSCRIQL